MLRTLFLLCFCVMPAQLLTADDLDFDLHIAPILAARCLECHAGATAKAKLNLTTQALAEKGGESGSAILAGKLTESLLWQRVVNDEMPPKHALPAAEKELLKQWIVSGAKWGSQPIDPFRYTTQQRGGYNWWSLQPLTFPTVPELPSEFALDKTEFTAIDHFLAEKLAEQGLQFSPPTDKRTLIRRLWFDLLGLPPTPEQVAAFVKDTSPQAYEKLVERALASPHYGERWGRHWLDIVHFGESDGFEYDRMRPNAWPYRDWVIQALNKDMPYNTFVQWQIAGDALHPQEHDAITAAGFLVHGAHDSLMPAGDAMRQIMRQDELEDMIGLVSQTFLGMTVNCARCHDHKFDAISAQDYYRMASALAGVRRGVRTLPPKTIPLQLNEQIAQLTQQIQKLESLGRERVQTLIQQDAAKKTAPEAFVRWEFENDLQEQSQTIKATAFGNAKVKQGALLVYGQQDYVATEPIPREITEKTIEAWVKLNNLTQQGGGVITLQTIDGSLFDSLVFGEKTPGHWMAGSEFYRRTQPFNGMVETAAQERAVHIAIVYAADGTITAYRQGEPYGKPYKVDKLTTFAAGKSQLVFGMRHAPAGGNRMLAGSIERAALYDRALTAEEIAQSAAANGQVISKTQILAALTNVEQQQHATLTTELQQRETEKQSYLKVELFTVTPQQPTAPTHLLLRGNPQQKGEVLAPGGLSALKQVTATFTNDPNAPEAVRRRELADWITHANNSLFARTIVNRVWHYHFGQGFVTNPNDLGFNGGEPSHAKLLDFLAQNLREKQWSLKGLHRLIVSSAAYRQSSLPRDIGMLKDRDNHLLWRFSPRRLTAEEIRDSILQVSGQLNLAAGGPSFQDFKPYLNHGAQFYEPTDSLMPDAHKRTIYRMWARGGKSPLLDTLDCPDPSLLTPKRGSTTTPLQALAMLNNAFMLRMSVALAAKLERNAEQSVAAKIHLTYELLYSRPPTTVEVELGEKFLAAHSLSAYTRVLLNTNGFLYVE
jgi:Protein of unknown function (DUF1549)/Protein of unknown function (DUF1553)/Concanavalin A-like lectin/glucanases superfamily/Planctomycete cytochrome C